MRIGILAEDRSSEAMIHVTKRNDSLGRASLEIPSPHTPYTDACDTKRVAWGLLALSAQDMPGDDERTEAGCKFPTGGFLLWILVRLIHKNDVR
jgi:hypothetical protein